MSRALPGFSNRYDMIDRAGKSGRATGVHIHYEVRVNGNAVEPRRYLSASI